MAINATGAARNGSPPRNACARETSAAKPRVTHPSIPIGGPISASSTTITTMIPNRTASRPMPETIWKTMEIERKIPYVPWKPLIRFTPEGLIQ